MCGTAHQFKKKKKDRDSASISPNLSQIKQN